LKPVQIYQNKLFNNLKPDFLKINLEIKFPEILNELKGDYEWINCEFIGKKLIEVHFRQNPDFRYNNSVAIPVWDHENEENMQFIEDPDYFRKGFYIK